MISRTMAFHIGASSSLSICGRRLSDGGTCVTAVSTLSTDSYQSLSSTFPFPTRTASSSTLTGCQSFTNIKLASGISRQPSLSIRSQAVPRSSKSEDGRSSKRIWRRRKLAKKDPMSFKLERVPFLEEKVRKITESGEIISGDIERLLRSEDNRYQFVNDVAAEAKLYVESNRDEYGHKKAILHVLSNRMNDLGFSRPEAYLMPDPFKPGPGYLKEEDW